MEINNCPICLEKIKHISLITTNCKHQYCYKCMKIWLIRNPTYPMDRNQITDLHVYDEDQFKNTITISELLEDFFAMVSSKCKESIKNELNIISDQCHFMLNFRNKCQKMFDLVSQISSTFDYLIESFKSSSNCSTKSLKQKYLKIVRKQLNIVFKNISYIHDYQCQCMESFNKLKIIFDDINEIKNKPIYFIGFLEKIECYQYYLVKMYNQWIEHLKTLHEIYNFYFTINCILY